MGSRETVVWASAPERKYPFMVTFSPESAVVRYHNAYREAAQAHGYAASGGQLGWAAPIYVADTDERAREEAKAGIKSLFNNFLSMPWEMLLPPGYTSNTSMKATMKLRPALGAWPRKQTIDELIASGTIVVGNPATVRERIERVREQTGFDILISLLQFGVLPDHLARREYGNLRRRSNAEAALSFSMHRMGGGRRDRTGRGFGNGGREQLRHAAVAPVVHVQPVGRDKSLERQVLHIVPVAHHREPVEQVDAAFFGGPGDLVFHVRRFGFGQHAWAIACPSRPRRRRRP